MIFTHEIHKATLDCEAPLDLRIIARSLPNSEYCSTPVHQLLYRNRKVGVRAVCILYRSGVIICHGSIKQTRQFARILQKRGFIKDIKRIVLVTRSASHKLRGSIDYYKLTDALPGVSWNPGFFHAPILRRGKTNFIIFHTGRIVITGITSNSVLRKYVYPTILDLELCVD